MNIYGFTAKKADGSEISMSAYEGKVLLVVNTATGCGFTPQYKELQEMYEKYKDKGFEILDFPCNQFGEQAPGSDEEIHTFCTGHFGTTFQRFSKIDVKGENAHPVFKWLSENTTFKGFDKNPMGIFMSGFLKKADKDYKKTNDVKWNFTKFLIDRNGEIVSRFEPTTSLDKVEKEIAKAL